MGMSMSMGISCHRRTSSFYIYASGGWPCLPFQGETLTLGCISLLHRCLSPGRRRMTDLMLKGHWLFVGLSMLVG